MRGVIRNVGWLLLVAAVWGVTPGAFAGTLNLQLNNPPSNNILDGIYVGSYGAMNTATGAQTQIICDDFKDDSNFNAATYVVHSFSNLIGTVWGLGAANQYQQAAWLTLGMLQQTGTVQGFYSYAIWALFDPSDVAKWLTSYSDSSACNAVFGSGSWGGGKCTAGSPQDNNSIRVNSPTSLS